MEYMLNNAMEQQLNVKIEALLINIIQAIDFMRHMYGINRLLKLQEKTYSINNLDQNDVTNMINDLSSRMTGLSEPLDILMSTALES